MLETRWPLAGRGEELSRLTAALVARRGAVITGLAGTGKTTLAMTCLQLVRDREMSVARTTATHASQRLPFATLAPILPPDLGVDRLSRDGRGHLLRFYARAVTARAGARPLVVFVDDAHLLDDGSATLVHHLALTQAATVLVTVRTGEPAPDPVVAMWKDGLAERIEVGALGDAAIEELLVTVLGGPVDAASVRQLADRSRGNPLYLRELVTGAAETGALAEQGGIWRLRTGGMRPTARLAELVALRLGNLSDAERAVLELLALCEPLGQVRLDGLADPAAVEALERKGLIASRIDGRRVEVRLTHPVYRDVVRAGITPLRERALARSLAEAVEATGARRREDTLLLASLRLTGGGGSAELLVAGAIAARARHDYSLTERLARAATAEGSRSKHGSSPPRPPTSWVGPPRPSASLRRWPRTRPAKRSGPGWPWFALTTLTSLRAEKLTRGCWATRTTPSPIHPGATSCWPGACSLWARAAGRGPRCRPEGPCSGAGSADRSLPRTRR